MVTQLAQALRREQAYKDELVYLCETILTDIYVTSLPVGTVTCSRCGVSDNNLNCDAIEHTDDCLVLHAQSVMRKLKGKN